MKQQNEKQQRVNSPSTLLSQEENDTVFTLLGRRCQAMSTAVVQLFTTEAPAHSSWIKRLSGIACFVKDSSKRSYFIRVYCLKKHVLVWEEEMYDAISINKPREFMITFEGQDCMVALSFASDAEANVFYKMATTTVANRSKRKRSRKFSPTKTETNQENGGYDLSFFRVPNPTGGINQFTKMQQSKPALKKFDRKIDKNSISEPTGFVHVAHVGWNDQDKRPGKSKEDIILEQLFKEAGVTPEQLGNTKTRDAIYEFLDTNKVFESIQNDRFSTDIRKPAPTPQQQQKPRANLQTAPPVPTRHAPAQRQAPPPPPPSGISMKNRPPAELPTTKAPKVPPSRPPPIRDPSISDSKNGAPSNIPAPPPPPPPPPMPPMNLLKEADSQPKLPSAQNEMQAPKPTKIAPPQMSLSDQLREEIHKGVTLKPVEIPVPNENGDTKEPQFDNIVDALRAKLKNIARDVQPSSDEESISDNDDWN